MSGRTIFSTRHCTLSAHAAARARQRGVRKWVIDGVFCEADIVHPVGSGCLALTVSRNRLRELRGDGASARELEGLHRHFVVVSDDNTIVTVGKRRRGDEERRYRRQ